MIKGWGWRWITVVVTLLAIVAGCSTVNLPLCPTIAKSSYAPSEGGTAINKMIINQTKERGIEIRQLSWFAAEFHGFSPVVSSFQEDYKFMLCAFDPTIQKIFIRETYISCMSHADEWIKKVEAKKPEELMLTETKFVENCASPN